MFNMFKTHSDVHSAFSELSEQYKALLRRKFSALVRESVKQLNDKLSNPEDKEEFVQDMQARHTAISFPDTSVGGMLHTICKEEKLELGNYYPLFFILEDYVDKETDILRKNYECLVTGLHEVESFYDDYKDEVRRMHPYTVQVRYKVTPDTKSEINTIWTKICQRFNLPPLKVLLHDERYGSLLLMWVFDTDEETSAMIRNLLIQNLPANIPFLQENNITHLIYNFEVLYPVSVVQSHCFVLHSMVIPTGKRGCRKGKRFAYVAIKMWLLIHFHFLQIHL